MMMCFLLVWLLITRMFAPPPPNVDAPIVPPGQKENVQQVEPKEPTVSDDPGEPEQTVAETEAEPGWITLGSMDPESPYRMLVTFTNRGAAPSRIELNTTQYRDVQEQSGYLGQIVADQELAEASGDGVVVQVVGPGTPAHKFGLERGDKIVQILARNQLGRDTAQVIATFAEFREALSHTRPGDWIEIAVLRDGNKIEQRIQLGQYPKDIVRPETVPRSYEEYREMGGLRGVDERSDQLSFLMTLQQINDMKLAEPDWQQIDNSKMRGLLPSDPTLERELAGVALRNELWDIVSTKENEVVFKRTVPDWNLEVLRTYRLQKREDADPKFKHGAGYELTLDITVRNLDTKAHTIAYQLDGPTGLPLEGGWYGIKMGPDWGTYGIRDLVVRLHGNKSNVISSNVVHIDQIPNYWLKSHWIDNTPDYIGVDSRFFQCTLMPNRSNAEIAADEMWHSKIFPIRVGKKNTEWRTLTNISFRMWSKPTELQPNEAIEHSYTIFAGPKDTAILAEYGLSETISYGWFWFAAQPLLAFLHFLHWLGLPYAIAIIVLTVCVRLVLLPLSIKQAIGAIKMQEISPELKALAEKYKDDMQARSKAQRELFQKHGYNPLSGCLPIFIQLPIFIGLYKALTVDAGLYGAPLISSTVRWCSDLSAPDMLYNWSTFWNWVGWTSFNTGQHPLALGPYFSILPIITVVLFLAQMIITMPPPTDEQSRMMRTMMFIMMPIMGLLFFKFPSGLCLYFTISTLWGLVERRFIPKPKPKSVVATVPEPKTIEEKKPSGKKSKSREEQTQPKKEGRFAKWMREIMEKAAEQQKLGQQKQNKEKEKKKRKR